MGTSTLSEMFALHMDRPPVNATTPVLAAWHERRATVLDHLAAEGSATAHTAAASAHHYAATLATKGTTAMTSTNASDIVARLRNTATMDAGAAYLLSLHLDRPSLLAVAAASGLSRVDRLTDTVLRARVLKQTISARRKTAGLRNW
jgi:hypothetical protein